VARIALDNVTVDFKLYGANYSLRQTLFGRTGGRIRQEGERRKRRVIIRALEDVSFELDDGDRLGLVGHNGSGKTTLLKVLAGIYTPDLGTVAVGGKVSPLFTAAPGLDADDSGFENIRTCGMLLGMTRDEINSKFSDIAEFSELGDYLALPVRTYSAGMLTRLCFAIATAIDPDDNRFTQRANGRLDAMISRTRILVLASHSDLMLKDMCNRALLLEKGRAIAIGPVDEILKIYRERMIEPEARDQASVA
jgi:ABC-type polysaccharide/polyol phosphate transport system ATPase subunit